MDYRFTDPNETKRAVLRNNIEQSEREYASLEVAYTMQTALASDTSNSEDERTAYQANADATNARMVQLEKQLVEFCGQLDTLPAPSAPAPAEIVAE